MQFKTSLILLYFLNQSSDIFDSLYSFLSFTFECRASKAKTIKNLMHIERLYPSLN